MLYPLYGDQFAHPTSARVIALAIQNKINGFSRLRTNERVVEIGSRTQSQIR